MNMMNKFHKSGHKNVKMSGFVQIKQFLLMEQFELIWNDLHAYLEKKKRESLIFSPTPFRKYSLIMKRYDYISFKYGKVIYISLIVHC
jgi:hypothetical protein